MPGPITFTAPWLLIALFAIPALLWLLRITPPAPQRVSFPALRLLLGLPRSREEPARTPLWLLLLRAALAAVVIAALAGPLIRPITRLHARPLLLVIDDGWASAEDWPRRKQSIMAMIEDAARDNLPVYLMTTAPRPDRTIEALPSSANDARAKLENLDPVPWSTDRIAAAALVSALKLSGARVVWFCDGLASAGSDDLEKALRQRGDLSITVPAAGKNPMILFGPQSRAGVISVAVRRLNIGSRETGTIKARAADGRLVGETQFDFQASARDSEVRFVAPQGLLNEIARFEIAGHRNAGAVLLIDESSHKRDVGLVSAGSSEQNQPLLSDLYYIERALAPSATVSKGTIEKLASADRNIIMMTDWGRLSRAEHEKLSTWINGGGLLVRFAGPHLALQSDDLVPVPLRQGGRVLGGALSWETPQPLGAFTDNGPFASLGRSSDVHIRRQVLAEPAPDLATMTWAQLGDGTPLVTAATRGKGRIVLIHVGANTDWSDLPLSGVFVDMLNKLVALAAAPGASPSAVPFAGANEVYPLLRALDAYGVLGPPPPSAQPIDAQALKTLVPAASHPPGLYGKAEAAIAVNLGRADLQLSPLKAARTMPDERLGGSQTIDLKPALLMAALLLALADGVASIAIGRGFVSMGRRAALNVLAFGAAAAFAFHAHEAAADDRAIGEAMHSLRLAYIRTGDTEHDELSRAGLEGLSRTLAERTAVEPDKPASIDLDHDELVFYPLIYWQVPPTQTVLSDIAVAKLDRFMKTGGTLIIDTADADRKFSETSAGPGEVRLRTVLANLDLPPLEPISRTHVLTKSFYLLQDFPGRYANGRVWVEAEHGGADHDGVASIIIGSNDWAGAWARDANGNALVSVSPGGERQRERALRFGVNLVMYALTGNYKADQVHVPALLERLGQ